MKIRTTAKTIHAPMKADRMLSDKIPYANFINPDTIETKNGNLLQIIKVEGLFADTMDDELIDVEKNNRNALWMSLTDSSTAFYFHTIRRQINCELEGQYSIEFAQKLHDKWQNKINNNKQLFINEHYIAVVKKPPVGKINRFSDIVKSLSGKLNHEMREHYRQETLKDLNKVTQKIISNLAQYGAVKLVNHTSLNGKRMVSAGLSFLSYLINLEMREISAPTGSIATHINSKRVFFDEISGTIAHRNINNLSTYSAMISIKNYSGISYAGMLDKLLDLKVEMVVAQLFMPVPKGSIRNKIKHEERQHIQSDDGPTSETHKISSLLDSLGSDSSAAGHHCFSILCQAPTIKQLEDAISLIDSTLNEIGIIAIREDVGIQPAYFSMLPGNFSYVARQALINSKNIASLYSMHNGSSGKAKGNYWGEAVTVLEGLSGTPYYFNFHVRDVGNTVLIGPMGVGKTLVEGFLLSESMKFGGRLIIFDKDTGLEVFVRALGGTYSSLNAGKRTGFSPFQMPDTTDNRHFLIKLLCRMATLSGYVVNMGTDDLFKQAVEGAFNLPANDRVLRHIVHFFGMKKAGSVRSCFERWINDGDLAWIFDNEVDELSLNQDVMGFDMTAVLADDLFSNIIYFYLFYRLEQCLDGTKTRIVVAEGWKALQDEEFRKQIQDWSSTPRKKEAFLVIDTQSPKDIADSPIGCKIIQESVTQLFFANPKAEYNDYVGKFKLTKKEYQIIKTLDIESRYFLLKQDKKSVVVRLHLTDEFKDEIIVLSHRHKRKKLLEQTLEKNGNNPSDWLPLYCQRVVEEEKRCS
jgi:type IV secretion system protein VirB4